MRRIIILGVIFIGSVIIVDAITWKIGHIHSFGDLLVATGLAAGTVATVLALFTPLFDKKDKTTQNTTVAGNQSQPVIPPPSPMFSIPDPPADFVGRQSELDQLISAFDPPSGTSAIQAAVISGLTGGAGVGKTALARLLAQRLAPRFPDARLEINLRGFAPDPEKPLDPTEAMRGLLSPFFPGLTLPAEEPAMAALFQDTFRSRKCLLLLDNARDAAQVRPLLPPAPSAALVTSRNTFSLPGLHPLRLGTLSLEESRDLLCKVAPRLKSESEARLDALAKGCGQLPLALRVAASLLETRSDWTAQTLIDKLSNERTRLAALRSPGDPDLDVVAALELSYTALPDNLQRLFRALGVFPAPFDAHALAAIWQMDSPAEVDDPLGALLSRSLLDFRPESQDYALHDLTRLYAEERLCQNTEGAASILERHAICYLKAASEANSQYKRGGDQVVPALQSFAALWPHLQADWSRLTGQQACWPRPPFADRWLSDFPGRAAYVLDLFLPPRQLIPIQEAALEAARRLGDRKAQGVHLGNLGLAYRNLGQVEKAIDYHEQALAIARETSDRGGKGNALGNLGSAYYSLGQAEKAIGYYEQALAILREIGDRRGEGANLGNLGNAYSSLGQAEKAIETYEQALTIRREIGDRGGEGNDLNNLGVTYKQLAEMARARDCYKKALVIYQAILPPDHPNIKTTLDNLAGLDT